MATGFGAGYAPIAPGTVGTLAAIPIFLFLSTIPSPVYEVTLVTFFFFSCWVSEQAGHVWLKKDDQRIVIDEIMGFFVAALWIPKTLPFVLAAFFLFRFFDILKPPPIRWVESLRGGFGVVLDDVLAGIYANIVLHLIHHLTTTLAPGGKVLG
jgi:phosphatidylglycerophosphatase A